MTRCRVAHCRFNDSHITAAHKCGICGMYGHGQVECGKSQLIDRLARTIQSQDSVMTPCTIPGCTWNWSHKTEAHHCSTCGTRGGCACNAPDEISIQCPHCKVQCKFDNNVVVYTGNHCSICFEDGPVVIFKPCNHANVCKNCALSITRS